MARIKGIRIPHHKNTAKHVPEPIPTPPEVRLPMTMHSGTPAKPIVAAGDLVKVGQLIAEPGERVSSPVHASVSGKVKSIDEFNPITGEKELSIVITADGEQTPCEGSGNNPPMVTNTAEFLNAVQNSGVVGLGGAGYPTAAKLSLKEGTTLDYILINGMECEPFVTADARTMIDDTEDVCEGAKLLMEYIKPKQIIICIGDNNPEAIEKMKSKAGAGISVEVLPHKYPQGERKLLVYKVTGRIVPEGGRLTDVGCTVLNCTTVSVFAKYIKTGIPYSHRIVTVDGSGVKNPKNVIAPLGTAIKYLFDYCGGLTDDASRIIMGGTMMGKAVPSLEMPLVKTTNAVLALNEKDSELPLETACIKCGRCISECPMNLMPSLIEDAFEKKNTETLEKLKVNLCIECGCCAYLCPAVRPLAQVMTLSKNMLYNFGRSETGID